MAIKVSGTEVIDDSRNVVNIGTVDGRDIATDGTKLDGIEAGADVTDTANVTAAGALMKTGGTMTGDLILNADPTVALGAATKEYVDTIAAAGLHYHAPVRVESPSNLTATYNNGTSGVGATLTNSGTQAALVIDGVTVSNGDRVLIYTQTDATQNGVYTVTDTGSGSTNWVLTRATDADSYGASDPDALGQGDAFFVKEGDTGAGELYVMNTEGIITFGTTAITFTQVAATAVYTAGTGLSLTGTQFSIDGTVLVDSDIGSTVQAYSSVLQNTTASYTTAEESKLAGIEAGATADQTASEILTAIKTVDGAGSGLDADVLDGQQGTYYLDYTNFTNTPSIPSAANNATITLSAGNGMTGGGAFTTDQSANETITLSHADTSSQASVNNSGATVIQDVTLDTYGHVTGLESATLSASTVGAMASTNPVITSGTITEDVYAISGTSVTLEPDNGSVQTHTLSGTTYYSDGFSSGQAITLMINDGSSRTANWPTMTWVNNGGAAPTLATSGYTVVALWKVSTTLYGALVGDGS
jgi:hypothetical protein